MAKPELKIFLNLGAYTKELADNVAQRVAADISKRAKKIVRVDSSELRNSIRVDKIGDQMYEVLTDVPHNLAQEFGRPDLPQYGFTPYLRPATMQASQPGVIAAITIIASREALKKAKV